MDEPRRQDGDETRRRFAALLEAKKQRGGAPAVGRGSSGSPPAGGGAGRARPPAGGRGGAPRKSGHR